MSVNDWRLTEAQVSAADELYNKFPNWQFAVRTIEFLRKQQFESEEICLLMVVAVDSLYSTGLRYKPGLREKIARYVHGNRKKFVETTVIKPTLVEEMARQRPTSQTGNGDISFASKFFHFFVSAEYPIYDSFARIALGRLITVRDRRQYQIKLEPYPEFCKTCQLMTELKDAAGNKITIRQLDRCLWLMGQFFSLNKPRSKSDPLDHTDERPSKNEVMVLFKKHPDLAARLIRNGHQLDYSETSN